MTTRVNTVLNHSDEEKGLHRSETTVTMPPELFEKVSHTMLESGTSPMLIATSSTLLPRFPRWATTTSDSLIRHLSASLGKPYVYQVMGV